MPDTQYYARAMAGEIPPACDFIECPPQVASLPAHARPDCIGIGLFAFEMKAKPVVQSSYIGAQEHGPPQLGMIRTSTPPSLLKSPIANPRPISRSWKTGPLWSLTFW